ncbi:MAG: hypothetical protein ACKVK4_06395 [Flavobacteriales bacterium]|jgi:hypothetical protein|tara:strand:+ start:902 stop:1246 length:345 start_codon:yes stop_codon:yes gene_type:complete
MKKGILLLFVAVISLSTFAQQKEQYQKTAEKVVKTFTEVCALDADQQKALLPIMEAKQKELFAAREKFAGDKEGLKTANKEIGPKYWKQIKDAVGKENTDKMSQYWKEVNSKKK